MQQLVQDAVDNLKRAKSTDNTTGLLFTGGKDSMIILHLWRENFGGHPPLLVIDTHNQFDAIYEFRDKMADDWDLEYHIKSNTEFLEEVIWNEDNERDFAWDGPKTTECCQALKIDMIGEFIEEGFKSLIIGRRDADIDDKLGMKEERSYPFPHSRFHPLARWSDAHVKAYIKKHSIPLPEVYYEGYEHTDCVDCCFRGEEGDDWSAVDEEQRQKLNELREMGYM